jgi:hypothetical protein
MADDLKPCPWCKRNGRVYTNYAKDKANLLFQIRCENPRCKVKPHTTIYKSKSRAIAAWNNRRKDDDIA